MSEFWINDPCALFDCKIFPTQSMTKTEKLNALTRLAIIIAIIMYIMEYKHWFTFLLIALLVIVIIEYSGKSKNVEGLTCGSDMLENGMLENDAEIEGFSVVPTYVSDDFSQTIVAPTYAEEWHVPPPYYDIYSNVPAYDTFQEPMTPQAYPYGQYLTRTNLLPSDEYFTHQMDGSMVAAREYANNAYLRNDIAFRDNMTRITKKKLQRQFRQNCNDTFSPYSSY